MANIKINDLQPAQIEFADLADIKTSSIKGGILCLLVLSFGLQQISSKPTTRLNELILSSTAFDGLHT